MEANEIINELIKLYPNARCELNHQTPFQLACAVMLSAQTTDARVNLVTVELFEKYPDVEHMKNAEYADVAKIIKSIGLYRNKAANLIKMANEVAERHQGILPSKRKDLENLSGIGRKSANVILSESFHIPNIAVDTHVNRISKRLKLAKENDSLIQVETKLKRKIKRENWIYAHHLFIFFGRYKCFAKRPNCTDCPFTSFCRYYNQQK